MDSKWRKKWWSKETGIRCFVDKWKVKMWKRYAIQFYLPDLLWVKIGFDFDFFVCLWIFSFFDREIHVFIVFVFSLERIKINGFAFYRFFLSNVEEMHSHCGNVIFGLCIFVLFTKTALEKSVNYIKATLNFVDGIVRESSNMENKRYQ